MRRRSRTRRVLKWVGTVLCTLFAATFLLCPWVELGFSGKTGFVGLLDGLVGASWGHPPSYLGRGWLWGTTSRPSIDGFTWWPSAQFSTTRGHVALPPWMLLVIVALPTCFLWYMDRRRFAPGHCQKCGYNLTGNVSGRCPECGSKI